MVKHLKLGKSIFKVSKAGYMKATSLGFHNKYFHNTNEDNVLKVTVHTQFFFIYHHEIWAVELSKVCAFIYLLFSGLAKKNYIARFVF